MKPRPRFLVLLASLLFVATEALAASPGGYLFVTYRGERQPQEEQVHFALSKDGRDWAALNGGAPVLINGVGEGAARDPFLLRSHDGSKFYLLATDLAVHRNRDWRRAMRAGSRSIVVWESSDLVSWSAPRLAMVGDDFFGCVWAPEAIYDPEKEAYLVYWASTLSADGYAKHNIWASYTRDFVSFDPPFPFIERMGPLGDATVIHAGQTYSRFFRDAQVKAVIMESAPSLGGPWFEVTGFSLGREPGLELPICYPLSTSGDRASSWMLLLNDPRRGYQSYIAGNPADGVFFATPGGQFPFRFLQGSVLPLSVEEYERVRAAYSK